PTHNRAHLSFLFEVFPPSPPNTPLLTGQVEREGRSHSQPAKKVRKEGAEPRKEEGAQVQPGYDILLGATQASPQLGLIGEASGRKVGLDLNQTHTISLFGVQGGGKSYTLGSIVEMACMSIPGVNVLPRPLAAVIFHYSSTLDYRPEFTSMVTANTDEAQ